jgi:glycine oxidase
LFEQLFSGYSVSAPKITPVLGQMILFEADREVLNKMVLDGDQYLIPRLDGKILAGSTVEMNDFNKRTTLDALNQLKVFATSLLPSLEKFPVINHWAGLRPGTEKGIPYIDVHPDIQNLSINAGHFRNGLAMGPGSARLLVDLVLKRKTLINPEPYRLLNPH